MDEPLGNRFRKAVEAYEFRYAGRDVIIKAIKPPIQDDDGTWYLVGYRWQSFRHDFSKKLSKFSTDKYTKIIWVY